LVKDSFILQNKHHIFAQTTHSVIPPHTYLLRQEWLVSSCVWSRHRESLTSVV